MAVTTIAHKPDLTKEQAMEIFRSHFGGRYQVIPWSWPFPTLPQFRRDIWVKQSRFVAVAVRLDQTPGETKFVYTGGPPTMLASLLLYLSLGILMLFLYNDLVKEVRTFIETAPEFK